jgi:hypothetical protein
MIRVFARKTSFTPTDDLAFYGPPPLFHLPVKDNVCVSVTFTWDIANGEYLARQWSTRFRNVKLGGPAFGDPGGEFVPNRFIKEGVTFTSRGCTKRCPPCLVPIREGKLRELKIQPGYIVQDNNLLACSRGHILEVFDMLSRQTKGAEFKGGLDIDYLKRWHIDLLKSIKVNELWVACDRKEDLKRLDKAADLFGDFSINKKHCYVLVGKDGETQEEAQDRCIAVYRKGFLPFAQLYRDEQARQSRGEWRNFCYFWTHPGLYKKTISVKGETK